MVIGKSTLALLAMSMAAILVAFYRNSEANALLILIALAMAVLLVQRPILSRRLRFIAVAFLTLIGIYITLTLSAPSGEGIKNTIYAIVCAIIFLYFAREGNRIVHSPGAASILLGTAGLVLLIHLAADVATKNTVSGVTTYFLLATGLVQIARGASLLRTSAWIFFGISLVGTLLGHRIIAGLGIATLLAVLLLRLAPVGIVRNLFLAVLAAAVLLIVALYAGLWGFDIRDADALIKEYTGRTAQSGRQLIWPIIILQTSQSPWIGLGTGTTFSTLYNSEWSAHSYYLQIYMQTGLIGLGTLLSLLIAIWGAIGRPRKEQPLTIYLSGCFLLLVVHASTEVFLLQTSLLLGCSAWMLFGLGLGELGNRQGLGPAKRRRIKFLKSMVPTPELLQGHENSDSVTGAL